MNNTGASPKAKQIILDSLKMVDTIIEVVDARAPISSRNEEIKRLTKDKNRVIIINKSDLITKEDAEKVENYFKKEQRYSVCLSAKEGTSIKRLYYILEAIYKAKKERFERRKVKALPLKIMILGIPNVGKSQLINALTGRKIVNVENRPGSTRGQQWINIIPNVQLLDTPGILWATGRREALRRLEVIGNIKLTDAQDIANSIIDLLKLKVLNDKYTLEVTSKEDFLPKLAEKLNEEDINKAANIIIEDFREGKIDKILVDNFI